MASTVTVACKLPHGLTLRLFNMVEREEPVMGGGTRAVKVADPLPTTVEIAGYAVPFGKQPKALVAGGYALTPGVDEDFWTAWLAQNKDTDLVKSNLIFAHARQDSAQGKAKDQAEIKNGLEPLDPEKPAPGIRRADKAA